ncbi:MAG: hypothetical protein G01um101425_101 [Candidatus Peregrinibacteria bacterium Gr01-1014_25]|nr:MAG: hypothetical protein G01um101425_101 [Candidatus Peregrinibacteria bacterium Gr01-1014_25]
MNEAPIRTGDADRIVRGAVIALFIIAWSLLLPGRLAEPATQTFADDAGDYHNVAAHLVREGMYSSGGIVPTNEREPGYSIVLALIYTVAGIGNRWAIFFAQAALQLIGAVVFMREWARWSSPRSATIAFVFLLLSPAVLHLVFFAYREAIAGSFMLLWFASLLRWLRTAHWPAAVAAGLAGGAVAMTYMPLLPLLLLVPCICLLLRDARLQCAVLLCITIVPLLLWVGRNMQHPATAECLLGGCTRGAAAWYVRSRQVTDLALWDPPRCLWAEYISHDIRRLPAACDFGVLAEHPLPVDPALRRIAERAMQHEALGKIMEHPAMHLWTSLWWLAEFHLPYVNGWGFAYNILETIATATLLLGALLAFVRRRSPLLLMTAVIIIGSATFAMIDVEPRYRMPLLGAYAALASLGFTKHRTNR